MTGMATRIITENFQMNRGVVVDRAAGTISGVRICGENSANGRKYPKKVFENSHTKYDGVNSYHGHDSRKFENLAATVEGTKLNAAGFPVCTLKVIMSDPYAAKLMEMAETCPEKIGLSHVAECKSHFEGGIEIIEEIVRVESVDIVTDPATNPKGLRGESRGTRPMKIKFALFVEKIGAKLGYKKLLAAKRMAEMDGIGDMEVSDPAPDATGDASMDGAFEDLLASVGKEYTAGNLSAEECIAKLTAFVKAHAGTDATPTDDAAAEESRKKAALVKPLTAEDVAKIVADALAKHVKAAAVEEKPKSGGKLPAKPVTEGADDLPTDSKALNELIRKG